MRFFAFLAFNDVMRQTKPEPDMKKDIFSKKIAGGN
jgi:hypothetical protein